MRFILKFVVWGAFLGASALAAALPSFQQVQSAHTASEITVTDRLGEVIASQRSNLQIRQSTWVPLHSASPALAQAVLLAEDQRFAEHAGVDWQAVAAAIWQNQGAGRTRGASSISMQLASLLNEDEARRLGRRNLVEKSQQMASALWLERSWQKHEILEAYLNRVDFRGELRGIGSASQVLFGKHASGIDKQEAATLAALLRAPNAHPNTVAMRACAILKQTRPGVACDKDKIAQRLRFKPSPVQATTAGAAQLIAAAKPAGKSQAGFGQTTIHAPTQRMVQAALHEQLLLLNARGAEDTAGVVLHNATGQVLAYVGTSGALSRAPDVDTASARRQAGSTLKPLLYATLLDQGRLNAATLLDDSPLVLASLAGAYSPRNYNERYLGPVSVRKALASSLNIPAVRAIQLTELPHFHSKLQAAGLSLDRDSDVLGEALALGAADVKLLELSNAYRTLANGGLHSPTTFSTQTPASKPARVFSTEAVFIVGDVLSDNSARASTFGFDSVLATPFWTAVKTGTSKDMRDNWCLGYSQHYTVGVWVGNASGKPMAHVSGVSGAAPAWAHIMRELHSKTGSKQPAPPTGVVDLPVRFVGSKGHNMEAPRREWFFAADAPAPERDGQVWVRLSNGPALARITYPLDGTQIAWDPDIPKAVARMNLQHSGAESFKPGQLKWQLNGAAVQGSSVAVRELKAGFNKLVLVSASGEVLDSIRLELRGKPRGS